MNGLTRTGRNAIITIAPAVVVYIFFFGLTNLTGHKGFGVGSDFMTILYNMVFSGFIALAMSYNLTSGRLDFSIGSVLILSLIAGGTLAKEWNAGPVSFCTYSCSLRYYLRTCFGNALCYAQTACDGNILRRDNDIRSHCLFTE